MVSAATHLELTASDMRPNDLPHNLPGEPDSHLLEERFLSVIREKINLVALSAAVVLSLSLTGLAQSRTRNSQPAVPTLMSSLPESDAIAQIKVNRVINEVIPRMMANNPGKLSEVNTNIDDFKNRTGLDPRSFEQIALGIRYSYPTEGVTKLITAGLARGTFSAGAMIAAGRLASNGKYREEKYAGKTVYIFSLDESIRLFGVIDLKLHELAASPIDTNTLAVGDPNSIRSVIDAAAGKKRNNAELISLATREPNAIASFGGNISPQVIKNLDLGNASLVGDLSGVRQAYGSVDTNEKDVNIFMGAKTVNADAAKNLGDTLEGLKQFGGLFIGRLTGAKGVLAKSALTNLSIATEANELRIRTAVAQADIGPLMGN
jgi:hypothetical protein